MNNYLIVLKALFKNKFRFSDSSSKAKKYGFTALIVILYACLEAFFISVLLEFKLMADLPTFKISIYFFGLITAAGIVLIFGVVNLVSTLYLSKDTDFYSMLPIKSSTVFAAKMSFVYLSEALIVGVILLPLMITFGIISQSWIWYYVITIIGLLIVPSLPLVLAAIVAIPVMFLASKLKNRSVVSLIFYLVLYGAFFGVYIYFIYASTDIADMTEESVLALTEAISVVLYIFYPYTALAMAACEIPSYDLGLAASTVANFAIFIGISVALLAIALLLAKFMYSQSTKANNQTNNSKSKHGEFKSSSMTRSLIKREFIASFRTTQVAFQCYAAVLIPSFIAIVFGIIFNNAFKGIDTSVDTEEALMALATLKHMMSLLGVGVVATMCATLGNGAFSSFSREGTALSSLKVLPCTPKQIVKAKALASTILAVIGSLAAVVIFSAFNFDLVVFLLSLFSVVPLSVAFVWFGVMWDLSAPKIKWVDPMQAIKHNWHLIIGQLICMIGGFLALVCVLLMMSFAEMLQPIVFISIFWSILYVTLLVFVVVDVLMLKKSDKNYNRIEI